MSVETTNFQKYQTGNPVVRRLIDRFFRAIREEVAAAPPGGVLLDAGCGEGETLARLESSAFSRRLAFDYNAPSARHTASRHHDITVWRGDINAIPLPDRSADLVLCLEVLEHLADPARALRELARVCRGSLILSVPHEPWFRLGSLARGKYLADWGNHPEHIQHWSPSSFARFLAQSVTVDTVRTSFPWIIARCRPKG